MENSFSSNESKVSVYLFRILDDPKGSVYPASKLADDWRGVYAEYVIPAREREWVKKNEGLLFDSDYDGEEFETVDIGGDAGDGEEDEEWFIKK